MKSPKLYLLHIQESIRRVKEYTAQGKDTFMSDTKTQDAVLRNLQTLAESTQRLPEDIKASRPEVPWKAVAGFRNLLVHDYLGLNLQTVWDICQRDLPPLERAVEAMLLEVAE